MAITNRAAVETARDKLRNSWYAVDNLVDRAMQDDLVGWDDLLAQTVAMFRGDADALADALEPTQHMRPGHRDRLMARILEESPGPHPEPPPDPRPAPPQVSE